MIRAADILVAGEWNYGRIKHVNVNYKHQCASKALLFELNGLHVVVLAK